MFIQKIYAGADFVYTTNIALSNTESWTANAILTTTDLANLYNGNTQIGILEANLQPIVSNTPNSINYTLTLTAPGNTTAQWIANSVSIMERSLYLFTTFTSNTNNIIISNTDIIKVLAAV